MMETVWNDGGAYSFPAFRDAVSPEHRGDRGACHQGQRDVQTELLVAYERTRAAAHEAQVHQGEVGSGDEHEERQDPL